MKPKNIAASAFACALTFALTYTMARAADPLSTWNDGPTKQAIGTFVEKATKLGSPDFIATFDNDDSLWCEQRLYFQAFFVLDPIKQWLHSIRDGKTGKPASSSPTIGRLEERSKTTVSSPIPPFLA